MDSHVECPSRANERINRSARGRSAVIYEPVEPSRAWNIPGPYICAKGVYNVAPFVCPVNYSRSKLSGNEVPGSSLGPSHLPSPSAAALLVRICLSPSTDKP